jgi:hypothetical protein
LVGWQSQRPFKIKIQPPGDLHVRQEKVRRQEIKVDQRPFFDINVDQRPFFCTNVQPPGDHTVRQEKSPLEQQILAPTHHMPPSKPSFFSTPNDQNVLYGTTVYLVFIAAWLFSLLSPVLVLCLFYFHYKSAALLVAASIAACYIVPWPHSPSFRSFMAKGSTVYFRNCSLTYEKDLSKETTPPKMLLAVHPHGIFCMGWSILFAREELKQFTFCFASSLYNSPYFRVLSKMIGNPDSADKHTFKTLMSKNTPIALIPGGFESATITNPNVARVHVSKKGFIKYSLQYGYSLVPCYVFNENQTYSNVQGCWPCRFWCNR